MRIDADPFAAMRHAPGADTSSNGDAQPQSAESFAPIALRKLLNDHPEMRSEVIDNLAREGEIVNIIAPAKRGKSWTIIDLVLCIVAGWCWLGRFACRKGKVLVLDNELHPETMAKRYKTVLSARGMMLDQIADDLHIVSLRGRLQTVHQLANYLLQFTPGEYAAIVIDAMYRALPIGCDENKNADMAAIYNVLERVADHLRAVIIIVHHSSKGVQGGKSITDTGSGAGAIARAVDTHLILREHEEKDVVVLEAAARSFPPFEAFCLRWNFPTWSPAPELDPAKLKRDRQRSTKPKEEAAPKAVWTAEVFAGKFINDHPRVLSSIIVAAKAAGISERMAKMLVEAGEEAAKIYRWEPRNPNQPTRYANVEPPLFEDEDAPKPKRHRGAK